jgi:hypothetical protein
MKKLLLLIGFASLTINAQVPSYVPTNGLIGYWPFEGNANDISGNNNNGTVNGATLNQDRFGNANSAYVFNGVSNYINIANSSIAAFGTSSFTVSCWFNSSNNQQGNLIRYDNCLTGSGWGIQYNLTNGFYGMDGFEFPASRNGNSVRQQQANVNGVWQLITFVRNVTTMKDQLYINGILINEITFSTINNIQTGSPLRFGACGSYEFFKGSIDDVGMWNRALTTNEILNLYNGNICYQNITVTDTLVINTGILSYNPVTYNNTITIYPNPANDHITIDCGNIANVVGYHIEISNSLGQILFNQPMTNQQYNVALNSWSGNGIYFVRVFDAQNNVLTTRKIILQ